MPEVYGQLRTFSNGDEEFVRFFWNENKAREGETLFNDISIQEHWIDNDFNKVYVLYGRFEDGGELYPIKVTGDRVYLESVMLPEEEYIIEYDILGQP